MANLRCAEYSFYCCLNPLQHPCFDRHIHHVTALIAALCNTSGGVVYVESPNGIRHGQIQFSLFKKYLMEALTKAGIPESLLNTSELSTDDKFFCAIIISKSKRPFPYTFDGKMMDLQIDVHGILQHADVTEHGDQSLGIFPEDNPTHETELLTEAHQCPQEVPEVHLTTPQPSKARNPPPAHTAFRGLTWDHNKINWHNILSELQDSTEEWIISCDIWKPMSPMRITPDSDSLKCLFTSDSECIDTLRKVETNAPGLPLLAKHGYLSCPNLALLQHLPKSICVTSLQFLERMMFAFGLLCQTPGGKPSIHRFNTCSKLEKLSNIRQ